MDLIASIARTLNEAFPLSGRMLWCPFGVLTTCSYLPRVRSRCERPWALLCYAFGVLIGGAAITVGAKLLRWNTAAILSIVSGFALLVGMPTSVVPAAEGQEGGVPKPRRSALAMRQRAYLVQIEVAFQPLPELDAGFRKEFCEELRGGVERVYGAQWSVSVSEGGSVSLAAADGLERLSALDLLEGGDESDKRIFLVVARAGGKLTVSGREWDAASRRLSTTDVESTWERRTLGDAAIILLGRLFRPLLAVVDVQDNDVTLQLQAGDFPPTDPDRPAVRRGDVIVPFFRYLDRQGDVRQIQSLPWTYLVIEESAGPTVTARLATGLRSPLGTKRRVGVELLAIAVRPQHRDSALTLVRRGALQRPLAGHQVVVTARNPNDMVEPEEKKGAEAGAAQGVAAPAAEREPNVVRRLLTNRAGTALVPVEAEQPVVWLSVFSGQSVLARVPFVPGIEPKATLELPDDSLRLSVEGQLDLVKGRLIDTVAHRAVLVSRARALGRAGEWKSVEPLLVEIQEMPGVEAFTREVSAIRTLAADEAHARGDRAAEARIRQLANDTTELVRRYLDADRLASLKEELRELREVEKEGEKAAAPRR